MQNRPDLIILTGPTAAGKTDLSVRLAQMCGGEVISADSMQVYRRMNIGTAKASREEMQGIPHHLIDICEPWEDYNVVRFREQAKTAADEIRSRGHVPIVVGGTGFYIQALLYDIDFEEEPEENTLRAELLKEAAEEGGARRLHESLLAFDPDSYAAIPEGNVRRVVRAVEFYRNNGYPISEHNRRMREKPAAFSSLYYVLTREREELYRRIDSRVDRMMEQGLVGEVRGLLEEGIPRTAVSMQGLGYRQTADYLAGEISLQEAQERIKTETRHFAKRQLTWFRRERDVRWLNRSLVPADALLTRILDEMNEAAT